MIKVDTHFHTNFFFLSEKLTARKAKAVWKEWLEQDFDAVILTEHAFKNPVKSYLTLMAHRPKGAKTHIIPGVECVTKEGIDVIIFSKDTYVYLQKDILKPYSIPVEELHRRIMDDDQLYGVVTHPFILSDTGLAFHKDEEFIKKAIGDLRILEKHNSTLYPIEKTVRTLYLHKILKRLVNRLNKIDNVPDEFVTEEIAIFGGSDAHFPRDIGPHLKINIKCRNYDEIFEALVSSTVDREFINESPNSFPAPIYMIYNGVTTLLESIKKRGRFYRPDYLQKYGETENNWRLQPERDEVYELDS